MPELTPYFLNVDNWTLNQTKYLLIHLLLIRKNLKDMYFDTQAFFLNFLLKEGLEFLLFRRNT